MNPQIGRMPATVRSMITIEDYAGRIRTVGVQATVPASLATADIGLPSGLSVVLAEAQAALTALDLNHGDRLLPMSSTLLRVESLSSSRIEGIDVSHRRLYEALSDLPEAKQLAKEVARNVRAMTDAVALADRPLSPEIILQIHQRLFDGAGRMAPWAGRWRDAQNWIGGPDPSRAAYVPPPPEYIEPLIADLAAFAARTDVMPVAQAAILHAQFEGIHPFVDGNGRVGRSLLHGTLRHRRATTSITPPISASLLNDRADYFAALVAYQQHGDPLPICALTARATITACATGRRLAQALNDLHAEWWERLGKIRSHAGALRVLPHLIETPVVTSKAVATMLGTSESSALRVIERLENCEILTQQTTGRRNRVWAARELYAVLDAIL
jgi:Fic family protein